MKTTLVIRYIAVVCVAFTASCSDYLDAVPDRSLSVLTKISEYQQLLDNAQIYINAPGIAEIGTDDLYLTNDMWLATWVLPRNAYVWAADFYEGNTAVGYTSDWTYPYETIYYTNVVLDGLRRLEVSSAESDEYNEVKGHALFLRALHHYFLQEIFGQPYRPESASADLGIPLKLSSELSQTLYRATVQETFGQIVRDLQEALALLPENYQTANMFRASKAATHALLSRVYLTLQDYEKSLDHADACLGMYDVLLDFNDLAPSYNLPSPHNAEVLFKIRQVGHLPGLNPIIDPGLYASYSDDDLRKNTFFQLQESSGTPRIKTLYSGGTTPMSGLATDEVYLNSAECRARMGDSDGAMRDLNKLLEHRYAAGSFDPVAAVSPDEVLRKVLLERRKELVFRGTRWTDLRRLNQDPAYAVTLTRTLDGTEYRLPPNSSNYTYPIPLNEIVMNGFPQNERNETSN
ncbi:SusD family protein [Parapedobacter koreensis]|uniref:SusD family protein n=2 Tax=Parapedobacter koreensis TaxID=332977 RepID=A0A1H7MDY0_9SPHI|nr:SusD family protein [Parapedobacter koreensis]